MRTSPNIVIRTASGRTNLPDGYTLLEYIQNTGNAYIQTTIYGAATWYITAQEDSATKNAILIGTRSTNPATWYGTNYSTRTWDSVDISSSIKADIVANFATNSLTGTVNDVAFTREATSSMASSFKYCLFNAGTAYSFPFRGKIFGEVVAKNASGVEVFHGFPCKNSNNVVGLYDTVSGSFKSSSTSTQFVAGPDAPLGLEVPITEDAKRVYNLMKDDYILVSWNDTEAREISIGDYVEDELFGPFYVTEAQSAQFNAETGAYRHEIRFDREYIGWKNVLHMLTYNVNGQVVRRETEWSLTDTLANHLGEIIRNLTALGYNYGYSIQSGEIDESTAICVSFSGTSIYDALNALATAWKCEWWVTYNSGYSQGTIHFGKCASGTEVDIELGENAESIVPSKSEAEFANKIYAYGSTRNIPDTYRKSLVFTVTGTDSQTYDGASATVFQDSARPIRKDMLYISDENEFKRTVELTTPSYSYSEQSDSGYQNRATYSETFSIQQKVRYHITGDFNFVVSLERKNEGDPGDSAINYIRWSVKIDSDTIASGYTTTDSEGSHSVTFSLDTTKAIYGGTHTFEVSVWTERFESTEVALILNTITASQKTATLNTVGYYVTCPLVFDGNTYTVRFNPLCQEYSTSAFNWFDFLDGTPSGFGVGSTYTLEFSDGDSSGLKLLKVPTSYYTDDYGTETTLKLIGEKRLMLPVETGGYVTTITPQTNKLVEKVVIFEEIYPSCTLEVTGVQEGSYTANTEYSDGSKSYGTLPRYTITCQRIVSGGYVDFPFKTDYLTTNPLQVKFLTRDEGVKRGASSSASAGAGHKLSGMTFGVNFTESSQTYTIEWNEDFGAKLPNGVLKPEVGDAFVLLGWNTKAMESLHLIDTAEDELETNARAYLAAISEPQLTFTCTMMSDRMFSDGLLEMGQNVNVVRGTIEKSTRIIGYEYKLDIPEDSPVYTAGETETYSRLRAIEKALNAQTQSVTSSSGTASVPNASSDSSSGGQGGGSLTGILSWQSGSVTSFAGDSFNGSENKIITIPTDINHLVNANKLLRINAVVSTLTDGTIVVSLVDSNGNKIAPQIPSGAIIGGVNTKVQFSTSVSYDTSTEYTAVDGKVTLPAYPVNNLSWSDGTNNYSYNGTSGVTITAAQLGALTSSNIKTLTLNSGSFSGGTFNPAGNSNTTFTVPSALTHLSDWSALNSRINALESLWELDSNGYIHAKNDKSVWTGGFISGGGLSDEEGGSIVAALKDLTDVSNSLNPSAGQVLTYRNGEWNAETPQSGVSSISLTGEVTGSGTSTIVTSIATGAVSTNKLADLAVTAAKLAADSVTTAKIADGNVTLAKLANDAKSMTLWGQTATLGSAVAGDMSSVGKITFTAKSSETSTGNVLEVVTANGLTYLHTNLPIVSDDFISGGGLSDTSGGGTGSSTLAGLTDTTITNPDNGQFLKYNGSSWVNSPIALANIDGFSMATLAAGQVLRYNGQNWTNQMLSLGSLSGVDITNADEDFILKYDANGNWVATENTLGGLSDVEIAGTPTNGQALIYSNGSWVPGAAGGAADGPYFCTSSTGHEVTTKVVTPVTTITQVTTGMRLMVNFSNRNSQDNISLQISGMSTAYPCRERPFGSYFTYHWNASTIVEFVFENGYWDLIGNVPALNSALGSVKTINSLAELKIYDLSDSYIVASASTVKEIYDELSSGVSGGVKISNRRTSGTRIVTITIGTTAYDIYAPTSGSGSDASWGSDYSDGTVGLTIGGVTKYVYVQGVTGEFSWDNEDATNHTIDLTVKGDTYTLCLDGYSSGGGGGSSYTLPIASASRLGGIKVGSGLSINSTTGVLSVTGGGGGGTTYSAGDGIDITNDIISLDLYKRSSSVTTESRTSTSGRYYEVEMDSNGKVFVNVPWAGGGSGTSGVTSVAGLTGDITASQLLSALSLSDTISRDDLTNALSSYVSTSAMNTALNGYLPLTAGTSKPLTGTLVGRDFRPSSTETYDLGTSSYFWNNIYVKRIYLANGVYIDYDTDGYIYINGNLVASGYISAGGVSTT